MARICPFLAILPRRPKRRVEADLGKSEQLHCHANGAGRGCVWGSMRGLGSGSAWQLSLAGSHVQMDSATDPRAPMCVNALVRSYGLHQRYRAASLYRRGDCAGIPSGLTLRCRYAFQLRAAVGDAADRNERECVELYCSGWWSVRVTVGSTAGSNRVRPKLAGSDTIARARRV